jgi:hypothetical protein
VFPARRPSTADAVLGIWVHVRSFSGPGFHSGTGCHIIAISITVCRDPVKERCG